MRTLITMPEENSKFYSRLPANHIPLSELLTEEHLFYPVPENWHVIVTDIKNSTVAVRDGMHESVNFVATGSIVTVLNIAYKANISIPFFFGGDGATFIIPPDIIDQAMKALVLYQENVLTSFNLELRVGNVPVHILYKNSKELLISKLRSSEILFIPIVLGDGLGYAEKIIKGADYVFSSQSTEEVELDLTGMECRWDKIDPPENYDEVVTLLAVAGEGAKQSEAFKKVMCHIDEIFGTPQKRQPISVSKLKQKTTFTRMELELKARISYFRIFYFFQTWLNSFGGYLYFKTEKGRNYLSRLVSMSDTLVIDGRINTVISGTLQQRLQLEKALNELEVAGEIIYGLYVSRESVMSCYVRDLKDGHIHFVDGSEGGYTRAAGILKMKLRRNI